MGTKAKHHIAPVVRAAFLRGLELVEKEDGLTFSEMMRDAIREAGLLTVLDKVGKYIERTSDINVSGEHRHTHEGIPEGSAWIAEMLGEPEMESPTAAGEDGPILPH